MDAATNDAVSPYLSQRDDLMRQQQTAASVDRAKTAIRMLDSLDRRGATVTRLQANIDALRAEMNEATNQPDRIDVIHRISQCYVAILMGQAATNS